MWANHVIFLRQDILPLKQKKKQQQFLSKHDFLRSSSSSCSTCSCLGTMAVSGIDLKCVWLRVISWLVGMCFAVLTYYGVWIRFEHWRFWSFWRVCFTRTRSLTFSELSFGPVVWSSHFCFARLSFRCKVLYMDLELNSLDISGKV